MSDLDARLVTALGSWLTSLGQDALDLDRVLADESVSPVVRRSSAAALNYLFKSLDLIDDGIEGLGFLDDALVLRVAARRAGGGAPEVVQKLAADAELIREFLGALYPRLDAFVASLEESTVRGRSVEAIVSDASVREELSGDVAGWAGRYHAPAFVMDERGLVKLQAFLAAKLPA